MGRGDKRTRKGKIFKASFGKSRPRISKKVSKTPKAAKTVTKTPTASSKTTSAKKTK